MGYEIGSIDYADPSKMSMSQKEKMGLYEAIEHYGDSPGTTHVYILARDRDEAVKVMEAWLRRNSLPEESPKPKATELIEILTFNHANHTNSGVPFILTGPSLRLEEKVRDNINLH